MRGKDTDYKSLSDIICKAIEDEPFFNKESLKAKIKSIISGFRLNLSVNKYNAIETPTDAQKRLREIELKQIDLNFWKCRIRELVTEEQMNEFYTQLDIMREQKGFKK